MTREEYFLYEKQLNELLNLTCDSLTPDMLKMVEHYINVGEIEMAFELFCLELMEENIILSQERKNEIKELAKNCGLDELTVYEPLFWEKLNEYVCANDDL